jgi:LysM repeat protein
MRIPVLLLFVCRFATLPVNAQQKNAAFENYIRRYSHLAVQEEKKYKIPASITLAQALLESGAGRSVLARESNNHFGIKCHEWNGKSYHKDAEIPNECFRAYGSVEDSYRDHSRFLSERPRYAPLFELKKADYAKWAKGLQQYGYATDKQYAGKLIRLIEAYELNRYDKTSTKGVPSVRSSKTGIHSSVNKIHGLKYVVAGEGDTFKSLAEGLGMRAKKLADCNDAPVNFRIRRGDYIYIEKKKTKANKPNYNHQVRSGESMHSISQRYGIRMMNLYKMNRKETDFAPEVGDILKLR